MTEIGCDAIDSYVRLTHAATINDTFWIKCEDEDITWEEVSPYRNPFNEIISKVSFEGTGTLRNIETILEGVKPELNCEGSFLKCFRKEYSVLSNDCIQEESVVKPFICQRNFNIGQYGSDIFLYKQGDKYGHKLEPYSESLCSEITNIISPYNSVQYDVAVLDDKIASRCNLFTNEQFGFVPYYKIRRNNKDDLAKILEYFYQLGSEQEFREMLVIDALCFNQDRHQGNFGVLFNNDTLEVMKMSPVFDLNIALLTYATEEELKKVGDKIFESDYAPKLGSDFTELGQYAVNDIIKERLKDMCDFRFGFSGDDNFSETRVKLLEEIIQKQANAIIKKEKLQTKDVFFSSKRLEKEKLQEKREQAGKALQDFLEFYETVFLKQEDSVQNSCCMVSVCDDSDTTELYFELPEGISVTVDFYERTIRGYKDFKPVKNLKSDGKTDVFGISFSDDNALLYEKILKVMEQIKKE